jgi:hypothetical protein
VVERVQAEDSTADRRFCTKERERGRLLLCVERRGEERRGRRG